MERLEYLYIYISMCMGLAGSENRTEVCIIFPSLVKSVASAKMYSYAFLSERGFELFA